MVKTRRSIPIVIALMSIALLGVIIIQFLWIRSAILLKQEEFNTNVNAAMMRVANDLENTYGVNYLTRKLNEDSLKRVWMLANNPGLYQYLLSISDDSSFNGKSPNESIIQEQDIQNYDDVPPTYDPGEREQEAIKKVGGHTVVTTVNMNVSNGKYIIQKTTLSDPPAPPEPPEPAIEAVRFKKKKFINMMTTVANEFALSEVNLGLVLDSVIIRKTIKREFQYAQLPKDFDFAVYSVKGDSVIINSTKAESPLTDFSYKAPLLPSDFTEHKTLLLINIPFRFKFIFSSIAGMFVLAIFFTLAIIAAFAFSLHIIFKQKKIGDITNDFINNMTHELKTPLATISMAADTMSLSNVSGNATLVGEYSGMIKHEVKKLSRHVDRILEAAVTERKGNGHPNETIDLAALLESEVKLFEPQVLHRNGRILTNVSAGAYTVFVNEDLMRGIVCNLLDNALKYSNEAPDIKVALTQHGRHAVLSVQDNGIGITKTDQKLIFEKFYRASTGNRHDVKGFGLGLSFVKSVVESANGKVWVESEPGRGSVFFIEVPLQ